MNTDHKIEEVLEVVVPLLRCDFVEMIMANNHDYILFSLKKVNVLVRVYEIPEGSKTSKEELFRI